MQQNGNIIENLIKIWSKFSRLIFKMNHRNNYSNYNPEFIIYDHQFYDYSDKPFDNKIALFEELTQVSNFRC